MKDLKNKLDRNLLVDFILKTYNERNKENSDMCDYSRENVNSKDNNKNDYIVYGMQVD